MQGFLQKQLKVAESLLEAVDRQVSTATGIADSGAAGERWEQPLQCTPVRLGACTPGSTRTSGSLPGPRPGLPWRCR
jgi:hypothetical protein